MWYLLRPLFWEHSLELVNRKFVFKKKNESKEGLEWSKKNSTSLENAFNKLGLNYYEENLRLKINNELIDNGKKFKEIFTKALEAYDIKVTISISHEDGKKDYSSEVAALA